jgi:DNA-binding HxlR family transcriptional regulator
MLEGMEPKKRKPSCKVRTVLESLDEKDQVVLVNAISNESWLSGALARELTARGIAISEKPIVAHRRKVCSCAR